MYAALSTLVGSLVAIASGELFLRTFHPQVTLHPRYRYSNEYGSLLYPDCVMVHELPGRWRFEYGINRYGYRGAPVAPGRSHERAIIVVLGDSNAFGFGVNDGEEFPAVLAEYLRETHAVVNLAVPGWGLTQQVRRYIDFGARYEPAVVVLQFCKNDPIDNLKNRVVTVENGQLRLHDSPHIYNQVKKYLSRSWLQKSQLYNLFREVGFEYFSKEEADSALRTLRKEGSSAAPGESAEAVHNELLQAFARELKRTSVRLVLLSVNGELGAQGLIAREVATMEEAGLLEYYDARSWFVEAADYGTPEGHIWGARGHRVVAVNLARIIRDSR